MEDKEQGTALIGSQNKKRIPKAEALYSIGPIQSSLLPKLGYILGTQSPPAPLSIQYKNKVVIWDTYPSLISPFALRAGRARSKAHSVHFTKGLEARLAHRKSAVTWT